MGKVFKIIALIAVFFACTKDEPPTCYICTLTTTYYFTGHTFTSVKDYPVCGVDDEFIRFHEEINTYFNADAAPPYQQICICK